MRRLFYTTVMLATIAMPGAASARTWFMYEASDNTCASAPMSPAQTYQWASVNQGFATTVKKTDLDGGNLAVEVTAVTDGTNAETWEFYSDLEDCEIFTKIMSAMNPAAGLN